MNLSAQVTQNAPYPGAKNGEVICPVCYTAIARADPYAKVQQVNGVLQKVHGYHPGETIEEVPANKNGPN